MHLLLLLGIAVQQPQQPTAPAESLSVAPRIEWAEFPSELPAVLRDSARFGYLEVPADHAITDGRRIRIAILHLPARAERPAPDPVVSIAGGPGLPALELHMQLRLAGPHPSDVFRERRDLIVIDARGHGFSGPTRCRELDGAEPESDDAGADRPFLAMLIACRERLEREGVRLETLSSVQVAHDLELLRRALGATQLNLVGLSYGSRIAAEAARRYPAGIRAVYFAGPVPPGHAGPGAADRAAADLLETLVERCASRPECNRAYPKLRSEYELILARVRQAPARIRMPAAGGSGARELVVDEAVLRSGLAQLLRDRHLAAGVPLIVHTLAERGLGRAEAMAPQLLRSIDDDGYAVGTFFAFRCNDGMMSGTAGNTFRQRCRALLGERWQDQAAEPLRSDVPGLIMTGEIDPRTPPAFARSLAEGMPRAHLFIVPWKGHERPPDCESAIARAFFDAPAEPPDGTCLDSIPPIDFVTGVVASDWSARAVTSAWRNPWLAGGFATAALALFLVPAVAVPLRTRRARRRQLPVAGRTTAAALLVAVTGLALLLGYPAAIWAGLHRHPVVPVVGVLTPWTWVLVLPWLLLVAGAWAVYNNVGRGTLEGTDRSARVLVWMPLLGAALVLGVWAYCMLA